VLELATVIAESRDIVVEGVLHCPSQACRLEYPIIDGVPILVPNVQAYLSDNFFTLTARTDLPEQLEGILGDCVGPGSWFDSNRQHLSTYAWDAYADLDPEERPDEPRPGAVLRCLDRALGLMDRAPDSPIVDLGCSVGRTAFALAEQTDGLVIGLDSNFSMLQLAQRVLQQGRVRYPRRRVGIVYDRREFEVDLPGADRVDFWACDALMPPFEDSSFGTAVGMNVLDAVASPLALLSTIEGLLRPDGRAILSTPYDWTHGVTPPEGWIGGHSQRGPDAGASEPFLRSLLTPGEHPQSLRALKLLAETDVPWQTRLHDRSVVSYTAHLVVAAKTGSP
jgi:SAM-dependent methyltransferase/uncharacterized protein YbaR (Trm112 family)